MDNNTNTALDAESQVDVLIIGGGPAGTSAGLSLLKRNDLKVCLIERGDYSEHKFGESLASSSRSTLEYLGVWEQFKATQSMEAFTSQAAWGSDNLRPLDFMFAARSAAWSLDRPSLDRTLAEAFVARGGTMLTQSQVITCVRHDKGGWMVLIKLPNCETKTLFCKYIIDASGRRGVMRTNLNLPMTVHDRLVGVGCVGSVAKGSMYQFENRVEACEYGWWYLTPMSGNRVSVVLMSDPEIVNQMHATRSDVWLDLLAKMPHLAQGMNEVIFAEQPRSFPCFSSYLQELGGKDWVAVGDAAASFDPISSSGIQRALASGVHGAFMAIDGLFSTGSLLESYEQLIHQDFNQYLQNQWQSYQREARWQDHPFWVRRRAVLGIANSSTIKTRHYYEKSLDKAAVHLKAHELQTLFSLCDEGLSLKQVADNFAQVLRHLPIQKIMLGIQELIERSYIELSVDEAEDSVFFNTERMYYD